MVDRWVNAKVEFTIALEVSPDASDQEKADAAVDAFDGNFEDAAAEHVAVIRHETVEDGEPVEVDPAVRLSRLCSAVKEEVERLRLQAERLSIHLKQGVSQTATTQIIEKRQELRQQADRLQAILDQQGRGRPDG
jgi:glutamine synthetase type III